MLLTVFYFTAAAQNKDSLSSYHAKMMDSMYRIMVKEHYVLDTDVYIRQLPIKRKIQRDSLGLRKDSLNFVHRKLFDSTHKIFFTTKKSADHYKDSTHKKLILINYSSDSVKRKIATQRLKGDSLFRKKILLTRMPDSLKRMNKLHRLKYDSSRKAYVLNARLDSLHKFKVFRSVRLDSLKKVLLLQNIKSDSQRLKKYLQQRKTLLLQMQADTAIVRNGYRSRELSMEISCNSGDTVYINNNYKKVIIKIVPKQRLRLSTTINYREALNERDDAILKKMGIDVSRTNHSVTAVVNGAKPNDKAGSLQYNADDPVCKELNSETNIKRSLFIEVPDEVIIFLNTQYADANVENYVKNINAEILNGFLKMSSADNAVIKSRYSTIKVDDIKTANLNLSTTRFTGCNITAMTIVSNSSAMQLNNCTTMNVASVSDEYQVEKAGSISGNKDFGKFNIQNLKDQLVLSGTNADIKINKLNLETPLIKIDSKYADLKVPVYDLKNYSIYYEGSYKDINKISSATQMVSSTTIAAAALNAKKDSLAVNGKLTGINKTKYEATAGDVTGKHTKVDIVCPYCNVVFN